MLLTVDINKINNNINNQQVHLPADCLCPSDKVVYL